MATQSVSMLELRTQTEEILSRVKSGEVLLLTYRGEPVARLEPVAGPKIPPNDPFYSLADHASDECTGLSNSEIDKIVYRT